MTSLHESLTPDESREVVDLLRDLLRTSSVNPPGNEAGVVGILAARASAWGLTPRIVEVLPGRPNLFVELAGSGERPALMLNGHSDTVPPGEAPWEHDPFSGELVDGELWGRGAVDMKAGLASMLVAVAAAQRRGWQPKGDVRLAVTVGEEVDCVGARHLRDTGGLDGLGWIVIGEPTNLDVVAAHRGAIWLQIIGHGKTAHGSAPHLGAALFGQISSSFGDTRIAAGEVLATELHGDASLPEDVVLERLLDGTRNVTVYDARDFKAPYASGSARVDGYVVCPCSMATVGMIAGGVMANLVHRAASVALKEERKLVLVPRETPLSTIHLETMLRVRQAGATVLFAAPGFYHRPRSIDDLVDFVVARILDQLGVEHALAGRWGQ